MLATILQSVLAAPLVELGSIPWLTLVTFTPLLGAIALLFVPSAQVGVHRNTALFVTLGTFLLSLALVFGFDASTPAAAGPFTFQMAEGPVPWIEAIGVSYALGLDGISLWLVILTTFLMPIAIFATYEDVNKSVKEYMVCLLLLETGMIGALVAIDMFMFYVFWELMLIPMYLIIGVWGSEDRIYAAVKFFIYTMVGSLLMLLAILYVYFQTGADGTGYSFLLSDMLAVQLTYTEQFWLFAAFFLAFAVKVPLFPFHTWLPLAHVQAPTAGSVILAGVLLKMGTYGLLRFAFPLFPDALKTFAPFIAAVAVIGVVYGALVAMVQPNFKKLVAYSSVSHLGFCVLGLVAMTPMGIAGGIYIMLAHGVATGGLFLCVGILYERRHSKMIEDFGGIAKVMPMFATAFMIILFASVGLPGLNGFVGEFLALLGAAQSNFLWFDAPYFWQALPGETTYTLAAADSLPLTTNAAGPELTALIFASIAASGVIFAACYLLWMFRRVMFGPLTNPKNEDLEDLKPREIAYLVPILAMCIFMGVYPKFFLGPVEPAVHQFLQYMDANVTAKHTVTVERAGGDWIPQGKLLDTASSDEVAE